jgi:hypothetical protein
VTIRTAPGALTGLDLDRLVLRSAAGGSADTGTGPLVAAGLAADRPAVELAGSSRTTVSVDLGAREEPTWLILGQSHNLGWTATADGVDLGEPSLINGYANGWLIPAGAAVRVEMTWAPQRVVDIALAASVVGVLSALVLAFRRPRAVAADGSGDLTWVPLDRRPSMPRPFSLDRLRRFAGPRPSRFAFVVTVPVAGLLGWAFIGPVSGLVLALAAGACLRASRARPVLTLGGLLVFAGSVGWLLVQQLFREYPSGFDWPTYFDDVHQPALLAVALLVLDPVIDRCWLRRWWLSEDSPS